jgi:hypothetical protein
MTIMNAGFMMNARRYLESTSSAVFEEVYATTAAKTRPSCFIGHFLDAEKWRVGKGEYRGGPKQFLSTLPRCGSFTPARSGVQETGVQDRSLTVEQPYFCTPPSFTSRRKASHTKRCEYPTFLKTEKTE